MRWLNKIKPVSIYQGSDIPYVIMSDGIKLCYYNRYYDFPDKDNFQLHIKAEKDSIQKINTNTYRFKQFPLTVPFDKIVSLNDSILNGQYIKKAHIKQSGQQNIAVVKNRFLDKTYNLEKLIDGLSSFDNVFLIHGDNISDRARLTDGMFTLINHGKSWGRICVSIANELCPMNDRKYCWTESIPSLKMSCFGFHDNSDMAKFSSMMEYIGLNCEFLWK